MTYTKENLGIWTALAAFGAGWGLTISGFIVEPVGEVADSVLWILGQSLLYAGSVFGITSYFGAEQKKLRKDIQNFAFRLSRGEPESEQETEETEQ